jgi:outer membrane protein assembly factor BamE (lipoprotein component of BamABCDE complex)
MLLSLVLSACVSTGHSELASDETMAHVQVGETTKQEIMVLLGQPDGQLTTEMTGFTREWWSYSYASAVIDPLDYMLLYGLWFNGIGMYDTRYDVAMVFDHRGVLSSLSRTKTDYDMGRPFASGQVSSVSSKTIGFPEAGKQPMTFEDKLQF